MDGGIISRSRCRQREWRHYDLRCLSQAAPSPICHNLWAYTLPRVRGEPGAEKEAAAYVQVWRGKNIMTKRKSLGQVAYEAEYRLRGREDAACMSDLQRPGVRAVVRTEAIAGYVGKRGE